MVEEIRQIGYYIRLPFEILGKVLGFLLSNLFLILITGLIIWLVYKYWWAILKTFFWIYDSIKRKEKNAKEQTETNN